MKYLLLSSFILTMLLFTQEITAKSKTAPADSVVLPLKGLIESAKSKMAQEWQELAITEDEIINQMDGLPPFSIYKDNYFISGIPLNKSIDGETAGRCVSGKHQTQVYHKQATLQLISLSHLYTKVVLGYLSEVCSLQGQ